MRTPRTFGRQASVLADIMKERDEFWVSRAQYDENGAGAVARLNSLKG